MMHTVPVGFDLRKPVFPTRLQGTPRPIQPHRDLKSKLSQGFLLLLCNHGASSRAGAQQALAVEGGLSRAVPAPVSQGHQHAASSWGLCDPETGSDTQSQAGVQDSSQQKRPPIRRMESRRIDTACCPSGHNPTAESSRKKHSNDP